ncbi:MAG: hypothetical protein M1814_006633 [Vezdaea aestivalis]|nr:MAG: hypothetical protein M1814_006633 [Vezdaea aestivalis]
MDIIHSQRSPEPVPYHDAADRKRRRESSSASDEILAGEHLIVQLGQDEVWSVPVSEVDEGAAHRKATTQQDEREEIMLAHAMIEVEEMREITALAGQMEIKAGEAMRKLVLCISLGASKQITHTINEKRKGCQPRAVGLHLGKEVSVLSASALH